MEDHAVAELAAAGAHELLDRGQSEGDEEQAGLVDVAIVSVDDVDLGLVGVEAAAEPVGGHRAARPAAEDQDLFPRHCSCLLWSAQSLAVVWPAAIRAGPERRADNYAAEEVSVAGS